MQFLQHFLSLACKGFWSVIFLSALSAAAAAQVIVQDGFESGDLGHSENGFTWLSPNWTSIVRDDQYRVWASGEAREDGPYEGRQWENAPASDGRHSLRFNYPAGNKMAEQRFEFGTPEREIWARFSLRVPINYMHGEIEGSNADNAKLFAIWMDEYEFNGLGPTVVWQFRNDGQGGSYTTVYSVRSEPWDWDLSHRHSGEKQRTAFINYPSDQGRWMQLVFRAVAASALGEADGIIQMWRRWGDEEEFTLIHQITNAAIHAPDEGPAGWRAGYLMGWANGSYESDTEFLIDDFYLSTESLLSDTPKPRPPDDVSID